MTPVHTTPPQQPDPSNYEKGNIYVSPASDEKANQPNDIANYGDKEKTIVDPSGDSGKKPEGVFITKKKLKIGGAALAAGIVALYAGITTFNNKDKKEDPKPTETIESILPSESSEPSFTETGESTTINITPSASDTSETTTIETGETTQDPDTIKWFELDWSKQSQELQDLNNMSVEDFRNQPLEDQLLYYSFLNHIYHQTYSTGEYSEVSDMFATTNESATIDDSAEEIINQEINKAVLTYWAIKEDGYFDKTEARKLLSAQNYNLEQAIADGDEYGVSVFEKIILEMPDYEMPGVNINNINGVKGISRTDAAIGEDGNYHIIVKALKDDGKTSTMNFVFFTFKNYNGEDQSVWVNEDYTGKYSN